MSATTCSRSTGPIATTTPQVCVTCHNPASTDVSERQTLTATTPGIDGLWEQSIDFKYMIHSIHNGSVRGAGGSPFVIYGYMGSISNFTDVVYPGQINRCDACHQGTSYYPVDDSARAGDDARDRTLHADPESYDAR